MNSSYLPGPFDNSEGDDSITYDDGRKALGSAALTVGVVAGLLLTPELFKESSNLLIIASLVGCAALFLAGAELITRAKSE